MKKVKRIAFLLLCIASSTALYAANTDKEASEQNTPDGWTAVALPQLPAITKDNTFCITDFGASEASDDNTAAFQAALDAAGKAGGGKVVVPKGTWLSGPVAVKSKTIVHLAAGATLKLLPYGTYPAIGEKKFDNFISTGLNGTNPTVTDVIIEGEDKATSIIDGQGKDWWIAHEVAKEEGKGLSRGAVIRFRKGSRFMVRNITIMNAPGVNINISQNGGASDATIHDVIIRNPSSTTKTEQPSHNTDGIAMWGPRINIYNCDISTGDDNVVADSNAQFVHVWNCKFGDGHGASIGSYTENLHDILYEDCTFMGTGSGFRLKSQRGRSGDVYNITFRNCQMTGVINPVYIECWYDKSKKPVPSAAEAKEKDGKTPAFRDVLIQNVTSIGTPYKKSEKQYFPVFVYGLPESPIKNVTLDNVQLQAEKGMFLAFCDINFTNGTKITNTRDGKLIETEHEANISGSYK